MSQYDFAETSHPDAAALFKTTYEISHGFIPDNANHYDYFTADRTQTMHQIHYPKEPRYRTTHQITPMHLYPGEHSAKSLQANYMFNTTTGMTHHPWTTKQNPKYEQPNHKKAPANPKMSYIGDYQEAEKEKYLDGTLLATDAPTDTSYFVHPARKYESEFTSQYKQPEHSDNVTQNWNENVDDVRDKYRNLINTSQRPITIPENPPTTTYAATHNAPNSFLRADSRVDKASGEQSRLVFRDIQVRGKNKGGELSRHPDLPKDAQPQYQSGYTQSFKPLPHTGMTTTTLDTHDYKTPFDSSYGIGASSGYLSGPERNLGEHTTTHLDSFKAYEEDHEGDRDYTSKILRKPQILKKNNGVRLISKQYYGPGIGGKEMNGTLPHHSLSKITTQSGANITGYRSASANGYNRTRVNMEDMEETFRAHQTAPVVQQESSDYIPHFQSTTRRVNANTMNMSSLPHHAQFRT
jgi:hypothetical protein